MAERRLYDETFLYETSTDGCPFAEYVTAVLKGYLFACFADGMSVAASSVSSGRILS
jgi:hypothetical protein